MSALVKTIHPDDKIKAGKIGSNMMKTGAAIAVVFMLISLILGSMQGDHWKRFLHSYVIGWSFIFSIANGMLWIIILHHLVRGRWLTAVRRIAEAMSTAMPLIFLAGLGFVIPVAAGYKDLYYWAHPDAAIQTLNPTLHHKLSWLSPGFFTIRYIVYAVAFTGIAGYFARMSRKQDETGDPKLSDTMRIASGPLMILYAVLTCMVGFDVLMSLAPKWYSTIYGVCFWAGGNIGAFAAFGLVVMWVQRTGRLVHSVTEEHYHDIGKWLFSFTFFWAYTAFSQFMLQWYGNMPEETVWYKYRMFGEWQWVSIAILVGYWAFPFVFLMSRWTKRIVPSLVFFAVWQLVFTWLNLFWNVMPQYDWENQVSGSQHIVEGPLMGNLAHHHVGLTAVDFTVWIGLIGILLVGIGRNLTGNLIPTKDPTLPMSLGHEVM